MSGDLRYEKQNIQLRRNRVLELTAQSITQSDIAQQLGVSIATVSLDMQYLRCTAAQNLRSHIEERIPFRYSQCDAGLQVVLRRAWEIANNPNIRTDEVLRSLALITETYSRLMSISTDEPTLNQAISWINKKKESLQQEQLQEQQYQQSELSGSSEDLDGANEELEEERENVNRK